MRSQYCFSFRDRLRHIEAADRADFFANLLNSDRALYITRCFRRIVAKFDFVLKTVVTRYCPTPAIVAGLYSGGECANYECVYLELRPENYR